jgi:hypothetical protein
MLQVSKLQNKTWVSEALQLRSKNGCTRLLSNIVTSFSENMPLYIATCLMRTRLFVNQNQSIYRSSQVSVRRDHFLNASLRQRTLLETDRR